MVKQLIIHYPGILKSFLETNVMVIMTLFITLLIGLPLGVLLYGYSEKTLYYNRFKYQLLNVILNSLRSIPFLIFIFVLIPLNRMIFKSSFGLSATILPLSLVGISLYSRFIEQALINVNRNITERAVSMGSTKQQMIRYFLLPSIRKDMILSLTSVALSLVAYSTVVGVIGAGGLGDYAYRYGYQEYNYPLMHGIIIIFIVYVYILQSIGYYFAKKEN